MIAPVDLRGARGGLDYLGPEFLTWLWWRADTDPRFEHPDGAEVFVHVDEHLEFSGERAAARRTVLKTGAPGASMDARAALRSGKLLVAARLIFARGEEEWRFTLRAEDLDVSSLRLPKPPYRSSTRMRKSYFSVGTWISNGLLEMPTLSGFVGVSQQSIWVMM